MIQRKSLVKCLSMIVACLGVPVASAVETLTPLVETDLLIQPSFRRPLRARRSCSRLTRSSSMKRRSGGKVPAHFPSRMPCRRWSAVCSQIYCRLIPSLMWAGYSQFGRKKSPHNNCFQPAAHPSLSAHSKPPALLNKVLKDTPQKTN